MTDETFTPELPEEDLPVVPEETLPPQADTGSANETVTVVDIQFRSGSKVYFFDPDGLTLKAGDHVIMDTARGNEFGYCTGGNHEVSVRDVVAPLRKILRIATQKDEQIHEENLQKEKKAFEVCQQKIQSHGLDMQLVSAECAFDGSKIIFFFTADGRVDLRELVKNLASVFRTRIELRQIGVRDKAKMVGGLGICGRPFCCKEFLDDFQPVSIKMAKTQNLSLNPTKISGTCGRLMCCLKYEQEAYEDLLKTSPKAESYGDTVDGRGTVVDVNLLRQSVRVRMEEHPETINCYKNCDICVLRNGKAKKTDPPIPKDLAPISSKPRATRTGFLSAEDPMPEIRFNDPSVTETHHEPAPQKEEKPETSRTSANRRRKKKPAGHKPQENQPQAEGQKKPRPAKPQTEKTPQPKTEGQSPEHTPRKSHYRRRRRPHSGPKPEGGAPKTEG